MRVTLETMGTVASVELELPESEARIALVREILDRWESTFSLHRSDSELARIARGQLSLERSSELVRETYACALDWSARTDGAFTPHRPDGVLDLNGVVKALAIAEAASALEGAGCWSVNIGGDILVSAASTEGPSRQEGVTIGIADPDLPGALLTSVRLAGSRRAMATSGSAERGDHIWRGGSLTSTQFVQASVIADDIVTADVLATAIIAGGPDELDRLTDRFDIDVLTVDRDGQLRATPGLRAAIAVP